MRITILQGPFLPVPPKRGGAVEKMWFALGAEFAARGHEVVQVSRLCDDLPTREVLRSVRHLRVRGYDRPARMPASLALDFFYALRAARRAPDADVTVTNTFWAPVVLRRRHGAIYVDVQRMPKGQLKLYGRAARLRANSSSVVEAILAELPTARGRVRMIPNSLPFVPDRPVDWSRKTKTILFAGRIHPEKGIELLLAAWQCAKHAGAVDGWRLEIVGPVSVAEGGGGEAWLQGVRRKFSAVDVTWRPPVNDIGELNTLYEGASVFAYPSLAAKGETFGLAILEAMAWGAVPVASDLGCFRDFVVDGENGLIFDHAGTAAVENLAAALGRAAQPAARVMAERALAVRATHSSAAIAEQFLADFAALTAPAPRLSDG